MIVSIVQARMGSSRLPGKVLKEINGIPLLKTQIERVKNSKLLDNIIIATSTLQKDDVIMDFCIREGYHYYRGSEDDVLSRYYESATAFNADVIVRLTADCPLIDPDVIDATIKLFLDSKSDYTSNTVPYKTSRWPDGSDVEVFSIKALKKADEEATSSEDREHVTHYLWKNSLNKFVINQLGNACNWSGYRYTVDYPEDFFNIKKIINILDKNNMFGHVDEVVKIIDQHKREFK